VSGLLTADARAYGVDRWRSYHGNPRAFVHDLFRGNDGRPVELEDYQVAILEGLSRGEDVTVRSGHGVGKTTTDAFAVYYFLLTRPFSKIPTTAPTFRQVKDILWAEIRKWYQHFRLKEHLTLQSTRMGVRGRESEWFALGVASNKPEHIEGFHAPHVLFIVDEAKGVQKAIYDSIDGALTTGGQRLYTSTPGSRVGQFYESHYGRIAKFFHQIHVNGETSARVSRAWREQKVEEWGRDSPIYQAKVLGEFPTEGDDILIRLDYILAAEDAFDEEQCARCGKLEACGCDAPSVPAVPHAAVTAFGLDVARFGMDATALAYGSSARLEYVRTWTKRDLVYTASEAAAAFQRTPGARSVGVDDTGLGGGVTDMLTKIYLVPNMPVIFGSTSALTTAEKKEHFRNNKALFAWEYRKALEANYNARQRGLAGTYAICRDDKLKGQLSNLRIRHTNKGQLQVVDPDDPTVPVGELPKGVRSSPDRAHAAIIQYHTVTSSAGVGAGRMVAPGPKRRFPERQRIAAYIHGRGRPGG
jgi:phage terminase large subunit